jgi:hypothetical protein
MGLAPGVEFGTFVWEKNDVTTEVPKNIPAFMGSEREQQKLAANAFGSFIHPSIHFASSDPDCRR